MHRQLLIIFMVGLLCLSCQREQTSQSNKALEQTSELSKELSEQELQEEAPQKDTSRIDSSENRIIKAEKPKLNPAEMKFDSTVYDYGTIISGEVINHEFKFTNLGDRPLEINNVIGSCGCTAASFNFLPFPKGDSGVIKARFDSKGKIGQQENTLTVKSNHKDGDLVLIIKGMVKDPPKEEKD